jgi:hypothetical protein
MRVNLATSSVMLRERKRAVNNRAMVVKAAKALAKVL